MAGTVLKQEVNETATARISATAYSSAATSATQVLDQYIALDVDSLEIQREIRISEQDFKLFLVGSDSDEEPNDALLQAARNYYSKYR